MRKIKKTHADCVDGFTASAILDTSDFDSTRDLVNLPAFVEKFTAKSRQTLSKSAVEPGAPHTLVVACAGLRAAELTRYVEFSSLMWKRLSYMHMHPTSVNAAALDYGEIPQILQYALGNIVCSIIHYY